MFDSIANIISHYTIFTNKLVELPKITEEIPDYKSKYPLLEYLSSADDIEIINYIKLIEGVKNVSPILCHS